MAIKKGKWIEKYPLLAHGCKKHGARIGDHAKIGFLFTLLL